MNDALREAVRQEAGRETEPSAAIIDSQSVKTTEFKGRKRHIMVDVMGLLLAVIVRKASIQEREATGFVVLPRRWVVERTFAWLGRYRRLSKDYEQLPQASEAMIYAARVHLMLHV
jgi:putative transposase